MVEVNTIEMSVSGKKPQLIEVDGVRYILERETTKKVDNIQHLDKLIFKKFDEKEYAQNLKIVVGAISKETTKKEIINQILKDIDMKTLRKLVKRIKDKKPIKRHDGCLGFKVGDAYVQLVE